jgi:membrane protein YdbS with pleckstrin-like domain
MPTDAPRTPHPPTSAAGSRTAETTPPPERALWAGHPSQWCNLGMFVRHAFLSCVAIGAAIVLHLRPEPRELLGQGFVPALWVIAGLALIPALRAGWKALQLVTTRFEVTSERVRIRRGVLSRTWEELELYRVKDATLHQPFLYRLVGLSSIVLVTSDRTHPVVVVPAIPGGESLRESLRDSIELQRQRRGVRELDT